MGTEIVVITPKPVKPLPPPDKPEPKEPDDCGILGCKPEPTPCHGRDCYEPPQKPLCEKEGGCGFPDPAKIKSSLWKNYPTIGRPDRDGDGFDRPEKPAKKEPKEKPEKDGKYKVHVNGELGFVGPVPSGKLEAGFEYSGGCTLIPERTAE